MRRKKSEREEKTVFQQIFKFMLSQANAVQNLVPFSGESILHFYNNKNYLCRLTSFCCLLKDGNHFFQRSMAHYENILEVIKIEII